MNRSKDILIVTLLLAVAYLLATRDDAVIVTGGLHTPDASIAVLPFVNLTSSGNDESLSDALWDETIGALAKAPELRIASRASSSAFKGARENVESTGEALGVSYIVEGAVTRAGAQVRITAQLIRVHDGTHIWSDSYLRSADSTETVPSEIARSVALAIGTVIAQ